MSETSTGLKNRSWTGCARRDRGHGCGGSAQPRTRAVAPHGLRILPSSRCATPSSPCTSGHANPRSLALLAPRRTGLALCPSRIAIRSAPQAHPPIVPSAGRERDGRASSRWRGALPPRRARPRAADPYGCLSARRPSARRPSALPTAEPTAPRCAKDGVCVSWRARRAWARPSEVACACTRTRARGNRTLTCCRRAPHLGRSARVRRPLSRPNTHQHLCVCVVCVCSCVCGACFSVCLASVCDSTREYKRLSAVSACSHLCGLLSNPPLVAASSRSLVAARGDVVASSGDHQQIEFSGQALVASQAASGTKLARPGTQF